MITRHTPPKTKHTGEVSVTTWIPADLAAELDAYLASQVEGRVAVRPSRQAFVRMALRRALVEAQAASGQVRQ